VFEIYFPVQVKDQVHKAIADNHCEIINIDMNLDNTNEAIMAAAIRRITFLFKLRDTLHMKACILDGVHQDIINGLRESTPSSEIDRVLAFLKDTKSQAASPVAMDL
jgi:hypothetical protein